MPPGRLLLAFFIPILALSNLLLLAQVPKLNAEGFDAAEIGLHRHLVFEMEQLKQHQLAHGTFFFGPHSHENDVVSSYEPPLTLTQEKFLNDATIDVEEEVERCARYNFKISNVTHPKRRRLFLGALLADDSMEVLRAVGTEVYDMFHTVSFIESNTTQTLTPRRWKYYNSTTPAKKLITLHRLFGPKTRVSVDYYVAALPETSGIVGLEREWVQREGSSHRWALNGMRVDDIGIIADADEAFTRDFLRAMQICDVPEFRPNQDCMNPKVIASTMAFESSPNCVTKDRRLFHPDAILGECLEHVGDAMLHPLARREISEKHGKRLEGHGKDGNYSKYISEQGIGFNNSYPLWSATDFRNQVGGKMISMADGVSPTGYHFHNFLTVRMIFASSIIRMGIHWMTPWTSQYGS
ncbi:hypothetical protein ACHAXA_002429 [Cyclostephanos tholiformis]|uniref:Uncharacterized protein n=1 Tax=Cyclostephanos tholiformis TaxID=382380 RepID=A0ABD3R2F9_9STRA